MVVASLVVIILGLVHVGGFVPVWERSRDGGRINILEYVLSLLSRRQLGYGVSVFSNSLQ
jgi:hypothetical protein